MANSSEEIKALQKRLEKAEDDIEKLEKTDLIIAKRVAEALCLESYRTALLYLTGEESDAAHKIWGKRLGDTTKELRAAETVESVFKIHLRFGRELTEYTRGEKVKTAEEATEIAHTFIKKYTGFALPVKAVKEDHVWLVDIDVGALAVKIARVKVDAKTGDILSHEIPEK